jgi:hypothetical protein
MGGHAAGSGTLKNACKVLGRNLKSRRSFKDLDRGEITIG